MNRLQLLKEIYEQECHNLLCYSADYLMSEPKAGYDEEWKKEQEKVNLLNEMIAEEKQKMKGKNMSFTLDQILSMYPDTQYYVRNSNGGLLAGTRNFIKAKEYADEYKKEYLKDPLNKHLGVYVYDKQGNNVYLARAQKNCKNEEIEEFE